MCVQFCNRKNALVCGVIYKFKFKINKYFISKRTFCFKQKNND